eukprot:g17747.t1
MTFRERANAVAPPRVLPVAPIGSPVHLEYVSGVMYLCSGREEYSDWIGHAHGSGDTYRPKEGRAAGPLCTPVSGAGEGASSSSGISMQHLERFDAESHPASMYMNEGEQEADAAGSAWLVDGGICFETLDAEASAASQSVAPAPYYGPPAGKETENGTYRSALPPPDPKRRKVDEELGAPVVADDAEEETEDEYTTDPETGKHWPLK